jgi:AcrR family transcriptional regulator
MGRLQDERREETRQRLLDATVECLFERGYVGMTTAEVAQRAGVSKGAQQYHFPKKEELATAALQYLFQQRRVASQESLGKLPKDKKARISAIVDALWPVYRDRIFYAWLELAVASRTDLALRESVHRISREFFEEASKDWQKAFQEVGADARAFVVLNQFINGQLTALALSQVLTDDEDSDETKATLSALKEAGNFLLDRMKSHRRQVS